MIHKLQTITSITTVPYVNMALEAYLLHHVEPGTCILYLWQNRRTVVIGRNQNCFAECKCGQLEADGGYLARRLSGGGAVFHDLGNLNFTFLVRKNDYDVERQTEVILRSVRGHGIRAERTGRNDIQVDGRKFSGNAYYQAGDCCYHHGTILIDVDKEMMSHYLNVSREKLRSKGVDSVRSRVANLTEFAPEITVDGMKEQLVQAFSDVYGFPVREIGPEEIDQDEILSLREQLSSWEWLYGRKIPFTFQAEHRFPWGGAQLQMEVDEGIVCAVNFYSDALDADMVNRLSDVLEGQKYQGRALAAAVNQALAGNDLQQRMKADVSDWLREAIQ